MRKLARVGRPCEVVAEHRADVGEPQRTAARAAGVDLDPGELALHLADLPLVVPVDPGQRRRRRRRSAASQSAERPRAGQPVGRSDQPVDELGEPAGELDPVAADVVERQRGAEPGAASRRTSRRRCRTRSRPKRQVFWQVAHAERLAVLLRRSPSAPRTRGTQSAERVEVVVDEAEPAAHGRVLGEVEDGAGGRAAAGEVEQLGRDAEQRVGAGERPVGELDPEPVRGVAALDDVTEAEARR